MQSILHSKHRRLDLMAKIDKEIYTKAEWHKIREKRRREKEAKQLYIPEQSGEYFVLCLKHGKKYSAEYVNRLHRMVNRHTTVDYKFACMTDDPKGLDKDIIVIPTPSGLPGWWNKPYMYNRDLPIKGTILYMDLDVVIANNIDRLFQFQPGYWCTIRDFTRCMRPGWQQYNSSVVRFQTGQLGHLWDKFIEDPQAIQKQYFGDQDYLYHESVKQGKQARLFPDEWIMSWKWEIRSSRTFASGGTKGNRKLEHIENVRPRPETCICVFHGDPNPENCDDPWVKENWV